MALSSLFTLIAELTIVWRVEMEMKNTIEPSVDPSSATQDHLGLRRKVMIVISKWFTSEKEEK